MRASGLAGKGCHTSIPALLPEVDIRPALVVLPAGAADAVFLCVLHEGSVISFAGYASGVVSAVPLAVLSWIAKTAWKKIKGNIGGFLTVSSN